MRFRFSNVARAAVVLLVVSGCGGKAPVVTRPQAVQQVTVTADGAVKAADAALTGIEALTPNPIPRKTTIAIAKALESVGHGADSLADVLAAYVKSRGADDWTKVTGAINGIQKTLDAGLQDLPEPARTTARGILQPVTSALLLILTNLPAPAAGQNAWLIGKDGILISDHVDPAPARGVWVSQH